MTCTRVGELVLDPHPRSIRAARRFVVDLTSELDLNTETSDLASLAVSEIVTNAIIHAGGTVRVEASVDDDNLRIEVTDYEPTAAGLGEFSDDATAGRGLAIVAAVAGAWGVEPLPDLEGKTVWFTVRI